MPDTVGVVIPSRTLTEGIRVAKQVRGVDEVIVQLGSPVPPGHARNLGFRKTHSEIVVFIDDDVSIEPWYLSWLRTRPPTESWWAPTWACGVNDEWTRRAVMLYNLLQVPIPYMTLGAFIAVRRAPFEAVKGFNALAFAEDSDLGNRLGILGITKTVMPHYVTALKPIPSVQKVMDRYPEWSKFPCPKDTPFLRVR